MLMSLKGVSGMGIKQSTHITTTLSADSGYDFRILYISVIFYCFFLQNYNIIL